MDMTKKIGKASASAALALAIGCSCLAPAAAFADPTGGVSDTTKTQESHTDATSSKETATTLMSAVVNAIDGTWADANGGTHDNGRFVVTVPTGIVYENVNAGHFSESGAYDVNVAGIIRVDDTITATVTVGNFMNTIGGMGDVDEGTAGKDQGVRNPGSLTATVTQGKTVWTCDEISVMEDDEDGNAYVVGTTAQDSYSITGDVRNATKFVNNIRYDFVTGKVSA